MRRKFAVSFVFANLLFSSLYAIETTSIRMKGLGQDFQGVLLDDYTDVLNNPARQRLWKEARAYGKAGAEGNPVGLGYSFEKLPLFVLAEGAVDQTDNVSLGEDVSRISIFTNRLVQDSVKTKVRNDSYGGAAISGFGSESFGWGAGLFYDGANALDDHTRTFKDVTVDTITAQIIDYSESHAIARTKDVSSRPSARLGFHWDSALGENVSKQRDLVFSAFLPRPRADIISSTKTYHDSDPNGDNIPTPNYSETHNITSQEIRSSGKLGGGVNFHSRLSQPYFQSGVLFSLAYQPESFVLKDGNSSFTKNVFGTTTTVSLSGNEIRRAVKGNTYSGAFAVAGFWQVFEKIWLGSGIRADASHSKSSIDTIYKSTFHVVGASAMDLRTDVVNLRLPLCFEAGLTKFLTLRGNATGRWDYSRDEAAENSRFFGARRVTTVDTETGADVGLGLTAAWKNVAVDLYSSHDLVDTANIQLQVRVLFAGKPKPEPVPVDPTWKEDLPPSQ